MKGFTENVSQWDFWAEAPGIRDAFVVTEWNPHLLEEHLKAYPQANVLFTTHLHDLLPKVLAKYPAMEKNLFVPGAGSKELVDLVSGRTTSIQVLSLTEAFPRKVPGRKAAAILILNELHPFGGLVPALCVAEELRKVSGDIPVYEYQIPVREIFVPDRNWSIHGFPPSAAEITFSWREFSRVSAPPPELDPADCLVFFNPLHPAPPVSSALWKCYAGGARIVTAATPFTRELQGEGVLLYSPTLLEDFDPFQKPPGSTVNQALAGAIAKEITEWVR